MSSRHQLPEWSDIISDSSGSVTETRDESLENTEFQAEYPQLEQRSSLSCECDEIFAMLFEDCGDCECPTEIPQMAEEITVSPINNPHSHHHHHHHHLKACSKANEGKRKFINLQPAPEGVQKCNETVKKTRFDWDECIHKKFLAAVFDIGLRCASPKQILTLMEPHVPANFGPSVVKSHLQKYRSHTKLAHELFSKEMEIAFNIRREVVKSDKGYLHCFPVSSTL